MEAKSQCVKSCTRRWDWTGLGKPVNHPAQPPALTCNYSATVIRAHCQDPEWCLALDSERERLAGENLQVAKEKACPPTRRSSSQLISSLYDPVPFACGFSLFIQTYWLTLVSRHSLSSWATAHPQKKRANHFRSESNWLVPGRNPLPVR